MIGNLLLPFFSQFYICFVDPLFLAFYTLLFLLSFLWVLGSFVSVCFDLFIMVFCQLPEDFSCSYHEAYIKYLRPEVSIAGVWMWEEGDCGESMSPLSTWIQLPHFQHGKNLGQYPGL